MRGRKPKPTAQQISEGDPRKLGKNKLREKLASEPNASKGLPGCPEHLNGRARAAWTFWCEELGKMNLDCRPDAQMLEGACVNYSRAVQADLQIEREGITVEESTIDEESG
jgi:phage terminase small subunit